MRSFIKLLIKFKRIFFFVWFIGMGKIEVVKVLIELVFGDEKVFVCFDMSEYKE